MESVGKVATTCWLIGTAVVVAGWQLAAVQAADVNYAEDVEPILRTNCYECHDGGEQSADLRLDLRAAAFRGGDSGEPAIVAGQSQRSALMERVTSDDETLRMPPEQPPLSEREVSVLRDWIDAGAVWPDDLAGDDADPRDFWTFQPPQRPALPKLKRGEWLRNGIDHFVLARLEREGIMPSPEADRVTLVRRAFLDLVGLPPSVEDVDRFLLDNRVDAYDRLIDRLLRSPHYGERWGRIWLDAARYADSNGYEKDRSRQVWFYRDWVVQSLNDDLPYDQFLVEQLAGDQLPDANQSQHVATGFLRNSMINEEGGVHPEQFRMTAMFDRMEAIGKSILGLTIQCAQCHNHKYDPLTQAEYYQLFAFINNDHEANIPVYTANQLQQRASVLRQIDEIEEDLRHRHPDWTDRMAAWEVAAKDGLPEWHVIQPEVDDDSTGGQKYLLQSDGSFLAQGYAPTKHTVLMTTTTELQGITGFRLELMTDPNLPCGGPGRAENGMAALTEFMVQVAPTDDSVPATDVKWSAATSDVNPAEEPLADTFEDRSGSRRVTGPVTFAIDNDDLTAWGIDIGPGRRNQPRKAVFRTAAPISFASGTRLMIRLRQSHGGWNSNDNQNQNLGRFRLSVTTDDQPKADPLPAHVRRILQVSPAERTAARQREVFSYWRTTVPEWSVESERIDQLWQQHPEGSSQLVLKSRDHMRDTYQLIRGEFLQPGDRVEPGVPEFLHDLPDGAPPTRLTLARWITDRQSPTVARSIVNRVWQAYFGVGLIETSEDLGTRAAIPSHPQLLDWLAVEFMDRGWSLKELHRMIVRSATYRQSSYQNESLRSNDPYNRLLARGPRFRVDAEVVRDVALSVSGLLNLEVGGPSVHPPLPDFMVKPPVSYGPKPWPVDEGPDRYRRALYTFRFRSVPYPALEVFDAPNGDVACVRRSRSNTPLQALTMWNEDVFIECAQALASRMLTEGGRADMDRIRRGFRLCVSRQPSAAELAELRRLLTEQRDYLAKKAVEVPAESETLPGSTGACRSRPDGVSAVDYAAFVTVARVLLNLDETITKE